MLCVDVNVLVNGLNEQAADHDRVGKWLEDAVNGTEPVGIPDVVGSGFVRISSNRRIFSEPSTSTAAWSSLRSVLAAPAVRLLTPGEQHWGSFERLCHQVDARGNDVSDAYIAAYAIENNATLVTDDRGFSRFEGLRWRLPLDE